MLQTLPFESEYLPKPKKKRAAKVVEPVALNLSQFTPEYTKQYIGQNIYIKPNYIVSVPEFDSPKNLFSKARVANEKNLRNNKHASVLSDKAKKRICAAVNWLCASAAEKTVFSKSLNKRFNFKVNLITLTLPNTDTEIKEYEFKTKLMHPFLVYMKKYFGLKNYVWKVEFQNNGKLHLHLTTDTFIEHHIIRHTWNRLLKSNGYLDAFIRKFKHDNPNSTDVHAVWKVKNLSAYLAKYLSKNEQNDKQINGRIWGCNYELSDKNKCHVFVNRDECAVELCSLMNPEIKYKVLETVDKITGKVFKNAELFFIEASQWSTNISGIIRRVYDNHRFKIRNGLSFMQLPELN